DYYYVKDENGNRQYNEDGTAKLSLSASQLEKYQSGLCYTNPEACRIFMETTKEYKDIYVRDGKLVLVKDISNGVASKLAGEKQEGDIEHEGYVSGKQEQKIIVKLSRARRVAAPKGKDLFTTWSDRDMQSIQRASYNSSVAFQKDQVVDSQRTATEMQKAAKIEQYFQEAFYADVERLKKQEEMVQEIAVAYLTGGAQGVQGKIKSMAQDRVNAAIEKATGLPLTFISGMTSGLSPKKAFQNYTQELVTAHAAAATGWPQGFVSSLVSGSNMRDALNNYTKELVTSEIAKASGLPASAVSHFLSKVNKPKKRFLDNPNVKAVATVGAVVGGAIVGGPAGAAIALAVVNSAMAVAKASDRGQIKDLKSGAAIVGGAALAGTVTVASGGMVSAEISYSEENGFGAELSVGLSGVASTSMSVNESGDMSLGMSGGVEGIGKVGGELSYRGSEGFGAAGSIEVVGGLVATGVGYTEKQGARATLGIASKSGATIGLEYSESNGFASYAGTKELKATYSDAKGGGIKSTVGGDKFKTNVEITQKGGLDLNAELQHGNTSGKIGWNQQQGTNMSISHTEQFGNKDHFASASGSMTWSQNGGTNITANGRYGNPGQVNIIKNLTDMENTTNAMIDKHRKDAKDAARIKNIQANVRRMGGKPFSTEYLEMLTEEEIARLSHDMELFSQAKGKEDESHNTSRSEQSWWEEATQEFEDSLGVFKGKVVDKDGWVDENGEFHQRTCFVAGTLVKTNNGFKKIEEIQVGDLVLSWNEKTGQRNYQKVKQVFQRKTDLIYTVKYQDGTKLETTWNHPFYIEGKGFVQVKDLQVGNFSHTVNDKLSEISSISQDDREEVVYNFEVEENHTYYVGNSGILVHNDSGYDGKGSFDIFASKEKIAKFVGKTYGKKNLKQKVEQYVDGQWMGYQDGIYTGLKSIGQLGGPENEDEKKRRTEKVDKKSIYYRDGYRSTYNEGVFSGKVASIGSIFYAGYRTVKYIKGRGNTKSYSSTNSIRVKQVDEISLSELEPNHYITKNKKRMKELHEDIRTNGVKEPIKYVEHNGVKYIVNGHHRYYSSQKLGIKKVPVQSETLPYKGYKTPDDLIMKFGKHPGYWKYIK
ncbi:MAG: polymorphic toxin-type HINT domain-containing protein, partial [Spirochaetota bacterium]